MPLAIKQKNGNLYVFLKGEIDHHTAPDIRTSIDDAVISTENAKKIIIDFSGVTFMDSSGVGLVMGRYRLINGKGRILELNNLSQRDYKIFKMSGIEALCKISVNTAESKEVTYE